MFRILVIILLLYLAFRFVIQYVLPFFAHLLAKNLKDQMNGQPRRKENNPAKEKDDDKGQYIDYEEVKDK